MTNSNNDDFLICRKKYRKARMPDSTYSTERMAPFKLFDLLDSCLLANCMFCKVLINLYLPIPCQFSLKSKGKNSFLFLIFICFSKFKKLSTEPQEVLKNSEFLCKFFSLVIFNPLDPDPELDPDPDPNGEK